MATGIFKADTTFTASEAVVDIELGPIPYVSVGRIEASNTREEAHEKIIAKGTGSYYSFIVPEGFNVLKVGAGGKALYYVGVTPLKEYTVANVYAYSLSDGVRTNYRNTLSTSKFWKGYLVTYAGSTTISFSKTINTHTPDVEDY